MGAPMWYMDKSITGDDRCRGTLAPQNAMITRCPLFCYSASRQCGSGSSGLGRLDQPWDSEPVSCVAKATSITT